MTFMELYRKSNAFFVKLGNWDKVVHCMIGCFVAGLLLPVHPVAALLAPTFIGLACELLDKHFDGYDLLSWAVSGWMVLWIWHLC